MGDMNVGEYTAIACVADIREHRPCVREINGHEIAVFRVGGDFYAVSNVCPHQHAPVISEGPLDGHVISCPMHGWSYDLRTGRSVNASGCLRTYDLRIAGDMLELRIPEPPAEAAW
jgi:nitrite reductase/ring-hydroxylating ferredoxin subunit